MREQAEKIVPVETETPVFPLLDLPIIVTREVIKLLDPIDLLVFFNGAEMNLVLSRTESENFGGKKFLQCYQNQFSIKKYTSWGFIPKYLHLIIGTQKNPFKKMQTRFTTN